MNKFSSILLAVFLLLGFSSACFATDSNIIEAATLFRQDKYAEALQKLEQVRFPGREASKINFLKGHIYLAKLQPEVSRTMFSACLEDIEFTLSDYAQFGIAKSYYVAKNYDSAIWEYKKFIMDQADSVLVPDAMLEIGRCYQDSGRQKEALQAFLRMMKEFPRSYLIDECRYLMGESYEKLGMSRKAAAIYHSLNLDKPRSAYVKLALARLEKLTKKKGLSLEYVEKEKLFNYGMYLFGERKYKEAKQVFEKIANGASGQDLVDDALMMIGRCEFRQSRYKQALAYFKRAAALGGDKAGDSYYYLGLTRYTMGDFKGAISAYKITVNDHPETQFADEAQYRIAASYKKLKSSALAWQAYQDLLRKFPESPYGAETAFEQGFANYESGNYSNAFDFFSIGAQSKTRSYSIVAQCLFWKAKSAEKLGKKHEAAQAYQELIDRCDNTYYAYRAAQILSKKGYWLSGPSVRVSENSYVENYVPYSSNSQSEISEIMDVWGNLGLEGKNASVSSAVNEQTHYDKYQALMELRFLKYAAKEAAEYTIKAPLADKNKGKTSLALALMAGGEYRTPIYFAEKIVADYLSYGRADEISPDLWMLSYPRGFWYEIKFYAARHNVDPYLVLAVIREESRFNSQAISRSRALGLMQMMPRTGRGVAKILDINPFSTGWLFNPNVNIYMGSYYLSNVMKRFDNNAILALAGYNGGPNRVSKWLKKWKAEHAGEIDYDEFVEHIPFSETRNYVKKVLQSYYQYKKLYEGKRG